MQPAEGQICRHNPRTSDDLLETYRLSNSAEDFERIVRRFAALVLCECRRVTGNVYDAEDASQMVFLALAMEIKSGVRIAHPGAWLKRVSRRQALKIVRTRTRRRRREDAARRSEIHLVDADSPIDSTVIAGMIRDEIDQLPERYRLAVILHYFGGMTLELIAQELRITRPAVGTRLHRGRKMLAERLGRHGVWIDDATLTAALGVLVPAAVIGAVLRAATRPPAPALAAMPVAMRQMLQTITLATIQRPIRMAAITAALALGSSGLGIVIDRNAASFPTLRNVDPLELIWRTLKQRMSFHFQISSTENPKNAITPSTAKLIIASSPSIHEELFANSKTISSPHAEYFSPGTNEKAKDEKTGTQLVMKLAASPFPSPFPSSANHFVIHPLHVVASGMSNQPPPRERTVAADAPFMAAGSSMASHDPTTPPSTQAPAPTQPETITGSPIDSIASVDPATLHDCGEIADVAPTGKLTCTLTSEDRFASTSSSDGPHLIMLNGLNPAVETGAGLAPVPPLPEPATLLLWAGTGVLLGRRMRNRK